MKRPKTWSAQIIIHGLSQKNQGLGGRKLVQAPKGAALTVQEALLDVWRASLTVQRALCMSGRAGLTVQRAPCTCGGQA